MSMTGPDQITKCLKLSSHCITQFIFAYAVFPGVSVFEYSMHTCVYMHVTHKSFVFINTKPWEKRTAWERNLWWSLRDRMCGRKKS